MFCAAIVGVRADVDDVDPADVPSCWRWLIGLGDQPAGDERLAEADLVRDQEPRRRFWLAQVHLAEDVLHGPPLEALETGHDLGLDPGAVDVLHQRAPSAWSAAAIGGQISAHPCGSRSSPLPDRAISPRTRSMSRRRSGSRA